MISGAHVVIDTKNAEAARAFFREVLGFPHVNVVHGWLIFARPTSDAPFHPADDNGQHGLYLMCDDLKAEMDKLRKHGIRCDLAPEPQAARSASGPPKHATTHAG